MSTQATIICIAYTSVLKLFISNTKIAVTHLNECLFET